MLKRKLALVASGHSFVRIEHAHPFVPDLQKIKHVAKKNAKKVGYISLFLILKFFIKSSNLIKTKSKILIKELKKKFRKNKENYADELIEKKEVSKYLKVISEYKDKIRKMKDVIKEEEGIE
jgi:hypothetical protein